MFPLKITLMECIFAQQNAVVSTTTQWSVLIWEGNPQTGTLIAEFNSDGTILPHVEMGPGTRGTNVQASVDPNDPDQLFIYNPNNLPNQTFTVGYRIDVHDRVRHRVRRTQPPERQLALRGELRPERVPAQWRLDAILQPAGRPELPGHLPHRVPPARGLGHPRDR
jgi:hypothetical protein